MLREKILPTGIGHTTNCFLQVEGSDMADSNEACIYIPDSETPQSVKVSDLDLLESTSLTLLG